MSDGKFSEKLDEEEKDEILILDDKNYLDIPCNLVKSSSHEHIENTRKLENIGKEYAQVN